MDKGTSDEVLIVDPSLFSLHYDMALVAALRDEGLAARLVGRPLRSGERLNPGDLPFMPLFYRLGESQLSRRWPALGRVFKMLEHMVGTLRLVALVRRLRPRVVHWQWLPLPLVDSLGRRLIRRYAHTVFTAHNTTVFHGSGHVSFLQQVYERKARAGFDHYITHTDELAASLQALGIARQRITVIPHPPLDLKLTVADDQPIDDATHGADILFFGAIKEYKGVDLLVEACIRLAGERDDLRVRIVGKPFYDLSDLTRRVRDAGCAGNFTFDLRFVPDDELIRYVRASRIVVLPYRGIDASGALALAVQEEKAIVASRVGIFADTPYAEALVLVEPGQADELERALEELLSHPESLAALEARVRQLKQAMPSWQRFAATSNQAYRALDVEPDPTPPATETDLPSVARASNWRRVF